MILYEWLDRREKDGALTSWRDGLQIAQQAQLDEKTLFLEDREDYDAVPQNIIIGPIGVEGKKYPGIYKLQIGRKISLRPLLCRGPKDMGIELTFLVGAHEQDKKYKPRKAPEKASDRRDGLMAGTDKRRQYETPPKGKVN